MTEPAAQGPPSGSPAGSCTCPPSPPGATRIADDAAKQHPAHRAVLAEILAAELRRARQQPPHPAAAGGRFPACRRLGGLLAALWRPASHLPPSLCCGSARCVDPAATRWCWGVTTGTGTSHLLLGLAWPPARLAVGAGDATTAALAGELARGRRRPHPGPHRG